MTSCSQSEVPDVHEAFGIAADRLVVRGGVTYRINSEIPFSGSSVTFRPNGLMKSRIHYRNGKQEGLFELHYASGQLQSRFNMKNGNQDGLSEVFWKNGQLKTREHFKDGQKDGLFEWAAENGEISRTENWKDGVKID
jgi:antitoxin component YwqK of YwqJK toxin-antitoxin module